MKKIAHIFVLIFFLAFMIQGCKSHSDHSAYIRSVLTNLEKIESATYNSHVESYAPGDTSPAFTSLRFYKEYRNHSDTTIGSGFITFLQKDTTRMTFCYDGKMRATVYEDEKVMVIDSFKNSNLPFRPLTPPFFNYSSSILRYVLETRDSLSVYFDDHVDSLKLTATIYAGKQVEFFGKPFYLNDPYSKGDEVSKYEIWINKKSNLPYKIRREMSHDISVWNISIARFSKERLENFNAEEYFPADLKSVAYGTIRKPLKNDLEGKIAPDWILKDADNNILALSNIKTKVLLIQFTSVSCGPCRASVPFLKELATEYRNKDFELVSIESWTRNTNVLKNYKNKNNFEYKFLMSTDEVTRDYKITSVPVFFILDKNRVIKKIITGYGEGTTDKEIRDVIEKILKDKLTRVQI
jgi:thiol-disulfide isomerase/thioredoxin